MKNKMPYIALFVAYQKISNWFVNFREQRKKKTLRTTTDGMRNIEEKYYF